MEPSTSQMYCENEQKLKELMDEYMKLKQRRMEKDHVSGLHPAIRKRIYALKNLQKDTINLDAEFQRDVYNLERDFQCKHDAVFDKRTEIVNGNYEPEDEECKCIMFKMDRHVPNEGGESPQGIPKFWLGVLKNVSVIRPMIQEQDEQVLLYLTNIHACAKSSPELAFTLEFHFKPNPFFKNSVLTKTYLMKCAPDEENPFTFEGPEIYKAIGCEIMWNPGMNVTERREVQSSSTCITKTDSFFVFFSPPELTEGTPDSDRIEEYLENDFEVGHYLKERVVPRAILYFTGEIDDDISDGEESMTNFMESFEKTKVQADSESEDD